MISPKEKITIIGRIYPRLRENLKNCRLCPRGCRLNRLQGRKGYCRQGKTARIYNSFLHFGEEPPLVKEGGSGTIFFSGCSLKCVYCQNYKFSQLNQGKLIEEEDLAAIMLDLEKRGAENINLVTPAHFLPQILKALKAALEKGLRLPLIYNSSGYEKKEIIEMIHPLIDSWLLDFKYINPETAKKYSNAPEYPRYAREAILGLYKAEKSQNRGGSIRIPGIIIRHLILPGHLKESKKLLYWLKKNAPGLPLSIMAQYRPYFRAGSHPRINRSLDLPSYWEIKELAENLQLKGWLQEYQPPERFAGVNFRRTKR